MLGKWVGEEGGQEFPEKHRAGSRVQAQASWELLGSQRHSKWPAAADRGYQVTEGVSSGRGMAPSPGDP